MHPRLLELPWTIPHFGTITVYTYGVLLAAAYLLGLQLALKRAKARHLDGTRVMDLGIYIIISALVGAKLLLLVTDYQTFRSNPAELFNLVREGGVFYGGLITAAAGAPFFIRPVGPPPWTTCDAVSPRTCPGRAIAAPSVRSRRPSSARSSGRPSPSSCSSISPASAAVPRTKAHAASARREHHVRGA